LVFRERERKSEKSSHSFENLSLTETPFFVSKYEGLGNVTSVRMNEKLKAHDFADSDERSSSAADRAHAVKEVTFTEFCECINGEDSQEATEECDGGELREEECDNDEEEENPEKEFCHRRIANGLLNFFFTYEFPILILLVIPIAKAYPPLGATYLAPRITASWIAVMLIFLFSGLGLRTDELS